MDYLLAAIAGCSFAGGESSGDKCSREKSKEQNDVRNNEFNVEADTENEADRCADADYDGEHGTELPQPTGDLITLSCLTNCAPSTAQCSSSNNYFTIFYGNVDFYVLFRLHHKLYERILVAKVISSAKEQKDSKDPDLSVIRASWLLSSTCLRENMKTRSLRINAELFLELSHMLCLRWTH